MPCRFAHFVFAHLEVVPHVSSLHHPAGYLPGESQLSEKSHCCGAEGLENLQRHCLRTPALPALPLWRCSAGPLVEELLDGLAAPAVRPPRDLDRLRNLAGGEPPHEG